MSRLSGLVRFVLRFDRNYNAKLEGAEIADDEGLEEAFEVVVEVSEGVSPNHLYPTNYQTQCQEGHKGY